MRNQKLPWHLNDRYYTSDIDMEFEINPELKLVTQFLIEDKILREDEGRYFIEYDRLSEYHGTDLLEKEFTESVKSALEITTNPLTKEHLPKFVDKYKDAVKNLNDVEKKDILKKVYDDFPPVKQQELLTPRLFTTWKKLYPNVNIQVKDENTSDTMTKEVSPDVTRSPIFFMQRR